MSVYSYEPFFSFSDLSRFFDDAWARPVAGPQQVTRTDQGDRSIARGFTPKVDIFESQEQNRVTAIFELPGLSKENVKIDAQNGRLVVSGEQQPLKDVEEKGMVHRERSYGRFSRSIPLPQGVKPQEIQAQMENGLLTLTFPKTGQEQQPQRVTIQ
ncbi:hypothetical protein ACEPAF_4212 [Sanghuangporus sanghuang]|uniref:HSP20-like chaperone n=1 Tax=Sanghuangporus baumii TaxID=108892 RepID=A0A9Q5HW07_SANBA|nr:HSP20-like chaperone [Sanghuangporus baumii]